jgi:hypothetical protein
MDAFSASLRYEANRRLAAYARDRFPGKFSEMDDDSLYELANRVRATAKQYGINNENDVATFMDFTVMYAEDFHQAPWAANVLRDTTLSGWGKMQTLRQRVRASGVKL